MKRPPEIATAVERVFPADGGFPHWVPSSEMEARGLLHLDEPWESLSGAQVTAVARAASEIADEACYLSYVARYDGPNEPVQDFELASLRSDRYQELLDSVVLDYVVVSQHGRWGVFVTDEAAAVVTGPESFVSSVYRTLPPMKEQATRYATDILSTELPGLHAWLRDLLNGVLGPDDAAAVLASARGH
jgi:hypothetical protein